MPSRYLVLHKLVECFMKDPDLGKVTPAKRCSILQPLFVATGCDYLSFFSGIGKTNFYKVFSNMQHSYQVASKNKVNWTAHHSAFLSFLRLVGSAYYKKHVAAFDANSPHALFKQQRATSPEDHHQQWLYTIRDGVWQRADVKDDCVPSESALLLHWKRACWVIELWRQAECRRIESRPLNGNGWVLHNNQL